MGNFVSKQAADRFSFALSNVISLSYSRMALLVPAIKPLSLPIYDSKTMKRKSTFELCPSLTMTSS